MPFTPYVPPETGREDVIDVTPVPVAPEGTPVVPVAQIWPVEPTSTIVQVMEIVERWVRSGFRVTIRIWHNVRTPLKLTIAVGLDVFDFTVGRVFLVGTGIELVTAGICALMFGHRGWIALWEIIEISDQLDGFVPTCSMLALTSLKEG